MTIGISGDTSAGTATPAATADGALPGTIPEEGVAIFTPAGTFDRLRSDLPGSGRLLTADQDPLQMIVVLLRALLYQQQEGLNTSTDIEDLIAQASNDHPLN